MIKVERVFDLLEYYKSKYGQKVVVAGKEKGKWVEYKTDDFLEIVDNLSRGLVDLGIKKGDKIAIMAANRPEWNFVDFAINQIGAATVPLYPTLSDNDLHYIMDDADIVMIFVGTQELCEKVESALKQHEKNTPIYTFEEVQNERYWKEIEKRGATLTMDLGSYKSAVNEDDLLTLIYTSGTTGKPKGVFLSHKNLVSNFTDCAHLLPSNYKKAISFLPLSHIFERMVVYMYYFKGISIYYAESMDTIVADINDVKPNGFTTVPRVLEKVYDKIVAKGAALTGIKRTLFFWALNLGLKFKEPYNNSFFYKIKLSIARAIIFKKWREALGGEIVAIISGGAALQERLARIFWAAGIPVLEGYGLTETSPVIAVNNLEPKGLLFGSVGKVLKSVSVKIASDGEVLCKGPNITKGYYNNDQATQDSFNEDGYFKTGDIGELTPDGFLRITDRKKEMFKTAGGKYVAPQMLENKFMESVLIAQVMVVGEGRRFPSALIIPSFDDLKKWAEKKGITVSSKEDLVKNEKVISKYQEVIDKSNEGFGHWEQVKKFALLPNEWSINGGELTPKLSLKRKVILEKNKEIIDEIYKEEGADAASLEHKQE
jgi:long-chain acyl-CoA synthetase